MWEIISTDKCNLIYFLFLADMRVVGLKLKYELLKMSSISVE